MRLHGLELQAFGPFAVPQRVDFDRLASGGLFLLEGPTGAGKTTVLDAITFALYGGLSGEDAAEDRLHSHFADPSAEPSVTLEFSVRGVRYLITRVPEHRRPKRRGTGYTTEAMQVHLRRRDGGSWVSLSSNKAEVGDLIADIIGLSRSQFTQVMLLPQGEFARFLRCDDDARRAVLTKLFGTQLYDDITVELDRRRSVAIRARQAADAEIGAAVSAAAEAAGLDAQARGELISAAAADRRVRFKQIGDDQSAALALAARAAKAAAGRTRTALAAEQEAAGQQALMTRLTEALASLRGHEAERPEHDQRARRLDAARRAGPVRPLLAILADAEVAAGRERRALRELVGAGADAELAYLLAEDADSELVSRTGLQAAARAEADLRETTALDHLVEAESAVPGHQTALLALEASAAKAAASVASLAAARAELPERITAAEGRLAQARDAASGLDAGRKRQAELARLTAAAGRRAELEPLLDRKAAAMRQAVDAHQQLVDAHQRAMDARLAGLAAELAAELADGRACPVCGSAEHPAPAAARGAPVTAEAVAAARAQRDAAEAARQRIEKEHAELDREAARHAAVAAGNTVAGLAAEAAEVAGRVTAAERAAAQAPGLETELARLRGEQEQLGERLRAAATAEAEARQESGRARADLATLQEMLAEAAGDYPSVAARRAALSQAAEASRLLAAALGRLAAALAAEQKARATAATEALASGFDSLPEVRSAVLTPDQQLALGEHVASWDRALAAFQAAAQAPDLAALDPAQAGEIRAAAQRAAESLTRAMQAEQDARTAHDAQLVRAERLTGRLVRTSWSAPAATR